MQVGMLMWMLQLINGPSLISICESTVQEDHSFHKKMNSEDVCPRPSREMLDLLHGPG
jgi:hypothetical protein